MKRMLHFCAVVFAMMLFISARAERINHEGRILGPLLTVTNAVLFNTNMADAVVSSMQIFPPNNPWNEDISRAPVLPNSADMISKITNDLAVDRQTLKLFFEMNYVLVPTNQPNVPITFFMYANESDPSPYPIPTNMPVETWPRASPTNDLVAWQKDATNYGGDRHSIIVMPGSNLVWETWLTKLTNTGWRAANGAKFNMNGNTLRTPGWTSADAAGLPMFPALVRYDECQRGMVEHAMRIVVKQTRREYIYPATHFASTNSASLTNIPAMGQRLRLKQNFTIPSNWTLEEKAVAKGLKKYGAFVADNGNFFSISVTPDNRWPSGCFNRINSLSITNFEVIQTTGPTNGTRTPHPHVAYAGADFNANTGAPMTLQGYVATFTNFPVTNVWKPYSGPTNLVFANTNQTNTTVTFNTTGTYTLMLSSDDGVHPIAYDAVVVNVVSNPIFTGAVRSGTNVNLTWVGGSPPFVLEKTASFSPANWIPVLTNNASPANVPNLGNGGFFRLRSQ